MERINGSAVAVDLHGAGKDGFRDGNKALGIAATVVNAEYMNGVQEEIIRTIEAAGLTPTAADNTQLLQAINKLVKNPSDKIVRVASTAAINLAAPGANIDGVAMVAGDTFLEKDNATLANRGIYIWNGAAVPATRDPSADTGAELFGGMIIRVKEGTVNADTNWQVTNDGVVTIGVTGLTFQKVSASAVVTAASDPTFVDNSISAASTSWVRGAMSAIAIAAGFSVSLTANGFIKFPSWLGGLIIEWGKQSFADFAGNLTVPCTFPIAFPNNVFNIVLTPGLTSGFDASSMVMEGTVTLSGFSGNIAEKASVSQVGGQLRYIAIGN